MQAHAAAIAAAVRQLLPAPFALVDLGAGDGAKAARLFGTLQPARYVAVDIAEDHLRQALTALQQQHPQLPMTGVVTDFSQQLVLPEGVHEGASLVFYPGSSIGNFAPDDALRLLRQAREASRGGALLIGVDLVKPRPLLEAAYDDALGVTAAFNLNLLRNVNRLLGSDFEPRDWQHVALFEAHASTHRDAPAGAARPDRALARARAPVCCRRACAHREFVQVGRRPASKPCCATPAGTTCKAGRTTGSGSGCSWRAPEMGVSALHGAGAQAGHDVVAIGGEEIAIAAVAHPRLRQVRSTAQHRPAVEPGLRVVAVGVRHESGPGFEGTGGPTPKRCPRQRPAAARRQHAPIRLRSAGGGPAQRHQAWASCALRCSAACARSSVCQWPARHCSQPAGSRRR